MRTIRFRAWDEADSQMYYAIEDGIRFDDDSIYEFRHFITPRIDDYHKWELMQYTGLKDKNGVEIYEGDICKCAIYIIGKEPAYHTNNVVRFSKGAFVMQEEVKRNLNVGNWNEIEVIGNIYENPELTK